MNKNFYNNNLSKSATLIKNILDLSNVGQKECSENMGKKDQFLRNYIYTDKNTKFGRDFAYNFLASIYHEISIKRKKNINDEFQTILKNKINIDNDIENNLILPSIERHVLALAKIDKEVFDIGEIAILDNYLQKIFPQESDEYINYLRSNDYPREGFKNIDNLQSTFENNLNTSDVEKFKLFEKRAESINNFYFICEKLRESYLPNFISLSDWKEIEMEYFNKGNFLIKRSKINNLKQSKISGGEVIIKSGKFTFEPLRKDSKGIKKTSWFFGNKKEEVFEEKNLELKIEKAKLEATRIAEETAKIIEHETAKTAAAVKSDVGKVIEKQNKQQDIISKFTSENLRLQKEVSHYKKLFEKRNRRQDKKSDEATLAIIDLWQKGKDIRIHEIDQYINKFGKNELIKNFVKNYFMTKIFDNSDELNLLKDFKEEKKRA